MPTQTQAKCIHGLQAEYCGLCLRLQRPQVSTPAVRSRSRYDRSNPIYQNEDPVIHSGSHALLVRDIRNLPAATTRVHFAGHPYLWAVKELMDHCPNLKTIRVLPCYEAQVRRHVTICAGRGVEIQFGLQRPAFSWQKGDVRRGGSLPRLRAWFQNLPPDPAAKWKELLRHGFEIAKIVERYLYLDDGKPWSLRVTAAHFGYNPNGAHMISAMVWGIAHYLDEQQPANEKSKQYCRALQTRMAAIHRLTAAQEWRRELEARLGVQHLPIGLPMSRLQEYEAVLIAEKTWPHDRNHNIVRMRFGIPDLLCHTLEEIGQLHSITRERVRQIEDLVLATLGF